MTVQKLSASLAALVTLRRRGSSAIGGADPQSLSYLSQSAFRPF